MSDLPSHTEALAAVLANCWLDDAFQAELIAAPKIVLRSHGVTLPDSVELKVEVDSPDLMHIVLGARVLPPPLRIEALPRRPSRQQIQAYVHERARTNRDFRTDLIAAPTETIRQLGCGFDAVRVATHVVTAQVRYLVIPLMPPLAFNAVTENEIAMLTTVDALAA